MPKKLLILTILLIPVRYSSGQTKVMGLKECMEYAVAKSTKIKIQQAETGDRRLEIRDAILTAFTPSVYAQSYAYYNFGRSIDPQTNTYFNLTSFHNSYSVSAQIDLFDGLKAVNNIKISRTGLLISQSREKQIEADICLAVMETYYSAVYYIRLAEVYKSQITEAEGMLALARKQEELGQKGYADVIQMEADLADREYDYTNTINQYNDRLMELEALMFWDERDSLSIDSVLPVYNNEIFDVDRIVGSALGLNPEVNIAKWNVENSMRELRVAKWQMLPSVSLYGGWNTSYYNSSGISSPKFGEQFINNRGEYIELSVSFPLYNRLKGWTNIKNKKNALIKAQNELEQKKMDIENEVRRAVLDCEGTAKAYNQALKKSWVQEEAYKLNRMKLQQGLISPLEFQTANNNFLRAKADEMNSLFNYVIKQAVVKYYGGTGYIAQM